MATSSTTPTNTLSFTGTSRYAIDFQNVITRAVAIAGLPITQINTDITALNSQATVLDDLQSKFSSLSDSVGALTTAVGSGSFNADVSDPKIANAAVTDGAMAGVYSIEVTALGGYTTDQSSDTGVLKVTDPTLTSLSTATNYRLTVGSSTYSITPTGNTLYALANAVNGSAAGVNATLVNLGSSSSPDYRLSLENSKLGNVAIQLNAVTTDTSHQPVYTPLMTEQVRGSLATFKPNGSSQTVSSDSRTVTLAPGLSVTMLAQSTAGQATSITLTHQSETISNALQSFVNSYNSAADDLKQIRGQSSSALSGQPIVYQLQNSLNQLTSYLQSGNPISSLADLGITFDKTLDGHLGFDEGTFLGNALQHMSAITSFLGDGTTTGFLKNATDTMTSVEDATRGILTSAITNNQTRVTNDNTRMATEQAKVDQLQTSLTQQMVAADSLISSMEQQYTVISNLFYAMNSSSGSLSGPTATNSLA